MVHYSVKVVVFEVLLLLVFLNISINASPLQAESNESSATDDFDYSSEETPGLSNETDKVKEPILNLFREIGPSLPIKIYKEVYNSSSRSRVCWKTITFIKENNKVKDDKSLWRDHEVVFDFPEQDFEDDIDDDDEKELVSYRIKNTETGSIELLNFTTVIENEQFTIRKSEKVTCGMGSVVIKTYYESPKSNETRVVVRLIERFEDFVDEIDQYAKHILKDDDPDISEKNKDTENNLAEKDSNGVPKNDGQVQDRNKSNKGKSIKNNIDNKHTRDDIAEKDSIEIFNEDGSNLEKQTQKMPIKDESIKHNENANSEVNYKKKRNNMTLEMGETSEQNEKKLRSKPKSDVKNGQKRSKDYGLRGSRQNDHTNVGINNSSEETNIEEEPKLDFYVDKANNTSIDITEFTTQPSVSKDFHGKKVNIVKVYDASADSNKTGNEINKNKTRNTNRRKKIQIKNDLIKPVVGASVPENIYGNDDNEYTTDDIFIVPEERYPAEVRSSSSMDSCSPILTALLSSKTLISVGNGVLPGLCSLKKDEQVMLKGEITVSKKYFNKDNIEIVEPLYTINENAEINTVPGKLD